MGYIFNDNHILIIAEAGVNHNGNLDTAKRLADQAKNCGADIVKYQTFNPDYLASVYAEMAEYQKNNMSFSQSQRDMLRDLSLTYEEFIKLAAYCSEIGIRFLSSPFDIDSIAFLDGLQDIWKIPSGEITNYPYLLKIAATGKPVIMSTGMSTMSEIEDAVDLLKKHDCGEVSLLHCTSEYPTPYDEVNLRAMLSIRDVFDCNVGYSDHTKGIEVSIAAAALGAVIIEKHFTLDKTMKGPDHRASIEPDELRKMIKSIRNIEASLGNGIKIPSDSEKKNVSVARKSITAAKGILRGELLCEENITTKRPGTGINPMRWNEVIGTYAIRNFMEDELIEI